jgi:hypothetical protein
VDSKSLVVIDTSKERVLLLQSRQRTRWCGGIDQKTGSTEMALECSGLRAKVEVGAANKLISTPCGDVIRCILQKLKIFPIIVTDKRHGAASAH